MSRFVLDCSVTMGWCFESEADRYTRGVLASLQTGSAVVPAVWPLEVANVLLVAERRRRITRGDSLRFLELLAALPVAVEGPTGVQGLTVLLDVGRDHQLSAYDAAYLHLAMLGRFPLATRDMRLKSAARDVGVAWYTADGRRAGAGETDDE